MIDIKQRARLQRAINRLLKAERALADDLLRVIYTNDPHAEAKAEVNAARMSLQRTLDALTVDDGSRR